ncbi:hypothetical protein, partial [Chromobacterium haemolyticum]|uniref:hypothetical protein n=1 Tax=Chromobacterium haemolyticum TaxID=394935 RepID=UPI001C4DFBDA
FGLLEKANDLFFGESALLHVRHSPSVTDFSLLLIGKAQGEQITERKRCPPLPEGERLRS